MILAGKLERKVTLKGIGVTKGARAAIEAAGGSVELTEKPRPKPGKQTKKAQASAKAPRPKAKLGDGASQHRQGHATAT